MSTSRRITICHDQVLLLVLALLPVGLCDPVLGDVIYVDDDADLAGDGNSWSTAHKYLQDALLRALPDDEIHLAGGRYTPDIDEKGIYTSGDRAASFGVQHSVTILGGYAGINAADPDSRNPSTWESVLSGDLAGDDEPGFVGNGENSYNVVVVMATNDIVVFDGITISGGNATGRYGGEDGAGVYNYMCDPTFRDCLFRGNSSLATSGLLGRGGGMYNERSQPTLIDCVFDSNRADFGGGMFNEQGSSATLNGCRFLQNRAAFGGGMYNQDDSNPVLNACSFEENMAVGGFFAVGGGMANYQSSPLLDQCIFDANSAEGGGHSYGGGMDNDESDPTLTACVFRRNWAAGTSETAGGAMHNDDAAPRLINCLFDSNQAGGTPWCAEGGAISVQSQSFPVLVGCVLVRNEAAGHGGAVCNDDHPLQMQITNCIVWGNQALVGTQDNEQIYVYGSSSAVHIAFSCIDGLHMYAGNNNIGDNPSFIDSNGPDGVAGTGDEDYRLSPGSPCIDAGDSTAVPEDVVNDLSGLPRIHACVVDIGAHEYQENRYYGDADENCVIDLDDYLDFSFCLERFGYEKSGVLDVCVEIFDADSDEDVDLADFAQFQQLFSGS